MLKLEAEAEGIACIAGTALCRFPSTGVLIPVQRRAEPGNSWTSGHSIGEGGGHSIVVLKVPN